MGTSTSHASPNRPVWNAARRALLDKEIPSERVLGELWTAAARDADKPILEQLMSPVVYELARAAVQAQSVTDVAQRAAKLIVSSKGSSVIVELARRAALQAAQSTSERSTAFVSALFSEVAGYIASRDIAGLVGASERLKDIPSTISFKTNMKEMTTQVVKHQRVSLDSLHAWHATVQSVTKALSGGRI